MRLGAICQLEGSRGRLILIGFEDQAEALLSQYSEIQNIWQFRAEKSWNVMTISAMSSDVCNSM